MKLIFAVLYVSLNDGPYTLLQNNSFLYSCRINVLINALMH